MFVEFMFYFDTHLLKMKITSAKPLFLFCCETFVVELMFCDEIIQKMPKPLILSWALYNYWITLNGPAHEILVLIAYHQTNLCKSEVSSVPPLPANIM